MGNFSGELPEPHHCWKWPVPSNPTKSPHAPNHGNTKHSRLGYHLETAIQTSSVSLQQPEGSLPTNG